jgi:hypothetical protein
LSLRTLKWALGVFAAILLIAVFSIFVLRSLEDADRALRSQKSLVQKACGKIAECKALGDNPVGRPENVIVWDLENGKVHAAQDLLDVSTQYTGGGGPVTVFLVTAKQQEQVGTYSVSREPAYREWVDVYVVQFRSSLDSGKAIGTHEVVSLDPASEREVINRPEFGDPAPPVADWVRALPAVPVARAKPDAPAPAPEKRAAAAPGGNGRRGRAAHPEPDWTPVPPEVQRNGWSEPTAVGETPRPAAARVPAKTEPGRGGARPPLVTGARIEQLPPLHTRERVVPDRRVSAILQGDGIYAVLEGVGDPEIVKPGSVTSDGYRVVAISSDSVTLRKVEGGLTYTQVVPLSDTMTADEEAVGKSAPARAAGSP